MAVVVWALVVGILVVQVLSRISLPAVVADQQVQSPPPAAGPLFNWPTLPWAGGVLATASLALYVAMAEISRLAGDVPDAAGRSWEFNTVMGPATLLDRDSAGWSFLLGQGHDQTIKKLLCIYLVLDFLFILVYGFVLWIVTPTRPWLRFTGLLVVVFDVLETALAAFANLTAPVASDLSAPQPWSARVLPFLSHLKWWAVVLLILGLLLTLLRPGGAGARAALARARYGLWIQRFSIVALLPIAVLGLFPGPNLLDQLPDVQRRWVDDASGNTHAFFTTVTIVAFSLVLFIFGRLRADRAYRLSSATPPLTPYAYPEPEADLRVWLVGPLVIGVLALISRIAGGPVSGARVGIFCGVFAGVAILSWILRQALTPFPVLSQALQPLAPRIPTPDRLSSVMKTGDILACAVFAVGCLGLVRSFTAPVALAISSGVEQPAASYALLFGGAVAALGVWLPVALLGARIRVGEPGLLIVPKSSPVPRFTAFAGMALPGYGPGTPHTMRRWLFLLLSILVVLVIGLWPVWLADMAGVIAIVIGSLAALSIAIGAVVLFEQNQPPPELLRLLKIFRITPVVTILVLVIAWSSAVGDDADVHGVSGRAPSAGTFQRPTPKAAFDTWIKQPSCPHTASVDGQPVSVDGKTVRLRPMLLVAAEGGGIRAAYWTAAAMERISSPKNWKGPGESEPGCSASAPFLSSGASGGAVGLTVARFSTKPLSQVHELAKPTALGAAVDGLLVRDLLFSATGLPLPVLGSDNLLPEDPRNALGRWEDRAGLIELEWQKQSSSLNTQFLEPVPAKNGLVGELALNSTAAGTGCRMLVSTVTLDPRPPKVKPGATQQDLETEAPAAATCDAVDDPAPYSSDTLALYGPAAKNDTVKNSPKDGETATGCVATMSAATAAMLASRFPYVTPSGVIGPCGPTPQQQLIDGGYTENYGLGTLADLSQHWLGQISKRNAAQLRTPAPAGSTPEIIVPIVVYLDNGTGSDLSTPTSKNTNEFLIPQKGRKTGGIAQSDSPAQLQRLAELVGVHQTGTPEQPVMGALWCPASDAKCGEITEAVTEWAPRPVIVVHQRTFPAVTAPLGWVLSESSMRTMDAALTEQEGHPCPPGNQAKGTIADNPLANDAVCQRGYGSLFDLIALLRSP